MFRPTKVQIDRQALAHNLKLLKAWNGNAFFCPMVKANGYGHGLFTVARVVQEVGASAAGVALVEEGLRLRQHGFRLSILSFAPLSFDAAYSAIQHGITPVVGRFEDLDAVIAAVESRPVGIHLKFNTGMQRLGFDRADLPRLRQVLSEQEGRILVTGVCTHLTHGEEAADPKGFTQTQLRRFHEMVEGFPGARHAHKSASLAALKGVKPDAAVGARPGIGIYGLAHDGHHHGEGLQPVMRWVSQLTNVHEVAAGEPVGYSAAWVAARKSWIGVVPVGYGDGYTRAYSNKGQMLFRGQKVPVVGRVCMDYTFVDLTDACAEGLPKPGEEIVLLGKQGELELRASDLAETAGTIAYEVVTGIQDRVTREEI